MPSRCVAWVLSGREGYGVRRATLGLTAQLRKLGWSTPLIGLTDGPILDECEDLGHHVVRMRCEIGGWLQGGLVSRGCRYLRWAIRQRRILPRLVAQLEGVGADAVHVRWPNLMPLAGAAGHKLGLPTFWQMPNIVGTDYPLGINRRIMQWQFVRYGITPLPNSHYTGRTLGEGRVRPVVLHLAVDPDEFDPGAIHARTRAELGIPDRAAVAGIVARLHHSKGQARVVEAMALLADAHPDLHLLLLGGPTDGPVADAIRRSAAEAGILDRVHLRGLVTDPQRHYPVMDFSINSRIDPEPFGLSVIESMMMGVPVLAHALGGPAETVVDGSTGWHLRDPSVEHIAKALDRVMSERDRWPALSQQARRHALDNFSTPVLAEKYCRIVLQHTGEPRGAAQRPPLDSSTT